MWPGPVFQVELTSTARRARYYVLRSLYGLVLLWIIWQNYQSHRGWNSMRSHLSINEMTWFAKSTCYSFLSAQAITVLLLTPALTAGVIADERQRKTLHYLLASRLSSTEIVLGKLLARLLHVGVFVAIGLPVFGLLSLFGGIEPELVALTVLGTLTSACFLAGLSVLVSTFARRARDAVITAYLLGTVWLVVPPLIEHPLKSEWPWVYKILGPMNQPFYWTTPWSALFGGGLSAANPERAGLMMALQLTFGATWVMLAVWRLRPSFRNEGSRRRGRLFRRFRLRLLPRPAIGRWPMLWKELFVARPGGMLRVVARLVTLLGLAFLGYWVFWLGLAAFEDLRLHGYGSQPRWGPQSDFHSLVQTSTAFLFSIWALGVAVTAAGSVTSEREEDTWTSLTTTNLDGGEIVGAKMVGALWGPRVLGATLVALWTLGLAAGAVHPLGYVAVMGELVVYSWFFAALGTFLSLHARNTTRAMAATIVVMFVINGGYLFCCLPFRPDTVLVALGCTPAMVTGSLLSYREVSDFLSPATPNVGTWRAEAIVTCVLSVLLYAAGAVGLTLAAIAGFDAAIDRPRRSFDNRTPIDHETMKFFVDDLA